MLRRCHPPTMRMRCVPFEVRREPEGMDMAATSARTRTLTPFRGKSTSRRAHDVSRMPPSCLLRPVVASPMEGVAELSIPRPRLPLRLQQWRGDRSRTSVRVAARAAAAPPMSTGARQRKRTIKVVPRMLVRTRPNAQTWMQKRRWVQRLTTKTWIPRFRHV